MPTSLGVSERLAPLLAGADYVFTAYTYLEAADGDLAFDPRVRIGGGPPRGPHYGITRAYSVGGDFQSKRRAGRVRLPGPPPGKKSY